MKTNNKLKYFAPLVIAAFITLAIPVDFEVEAQNICCETWWTIKLSGGPHGMEWSCTSDRDKKCYPCCGGGSDPGQN